MTTLNHEARQEDDRGHAYVKQRINGSTTCLIFLNRRKRRERRIRCTTLVRSGRGRGRNTEIPNTKYQTSRPRSSIGSVILHVSVFSVASCSNRGPANRAVVTLLSTASWRAARSSLAR